MWLTFTRESRSRALETVLRLEIGPQLDDCPGSRLNFLKRGKTKAHLKLVGKVPCWKEILDKVAMRFEGTGLQTIRRMVGKKLAGSAWVEGDWGFYRPLQEWQQDKVYCVAPLLGGFCKGITTSKLLIEEAAIEDVKLLIFDTKWSANIWHGSSRVFKHSKLVSRSL